MWTRRVVDNSMMLTIVTKSNLRMLDDQIRTYTLKKNEVISPLCLLKNLVVIALGLLSLACAAEADVSPEQMQIYIAKYDKVKRNHRDIYIGHFEDAQANEEVFSDASMPGGGYVFRKFLVDKTLDSSSKESVKAIDVLVPLDIVNKDKIDLSAKRKMRNFYQNRLIKINEKQGALTDAEYEKADRLGDLMVNEGFPIAIAGREEKLGHDYSLRSDIKYFLAFRRDRQGRVNLRSSKTKLYPFGNGLFVDHIDY